MTLTLPTYSYAIDWTGDGDYSDSNEDVSARVVDAPGFSCQRGRNQIRQLAPPQAGNASYDLDNATRVYSPEYAAGALYGALLPGRRTRAQAVHLSTTYNLWSGILDDLPQHPSEKTVSVPQLGTLSQLAGKTVSTALYTNIRTDQALGYLLDAVGWPAGERSFQTGKTTLLYWWLDATDAFTALQTILNTEGPGAAIYEDGRGYLVFENRHNRIQAARCTSVQATFRDSGTAPYHYPPFVYDAHLKDVINSVTIPVNLRTVQSLAVIWSLGQALTIPPYATTTINVKPTGGDIFTAAVAPVVTTDYTITAGSLTSLTLSRTSGPSTNLIITAGSNGATLTGLQLRAQLVTKVATNVVNTVDCSVSIAKYGLRPWTDAIWPEITLNEAQDFANAIAAAYREPRSTATITIKGADDTHLTQCFAREISDRIHITEYQSGLDADMFIEQIGHRLDGAGRSLETTFGCEKAPASLPYAMWGSGVWGTSAWGY